MRKHTQAFTLVEVVIALSIFGVIAISLNSMLMAGIRTWRSGNEWASQDQRARSFFYKISQDLKNAVNYAEDMPFLGESKKISFMKLEDALDKEGNFSTRLVRVFYELDSQKNVIIRKTAGQAEGFDERFALASKIVLDVEKLEFKFAYKGLYEAESVRWKDKWEFKKNIPRGVEISFDDFKTAVMIPMGVLGDEEKASDE